MDSLEAFGNYRTHAKQARALRRPVTTGPSAIFLPRNDYQRRVSLLVLHGGVIDRQRRRLASHMGIATLYAR